MNATNRPAGRIPTVKSAELLARYGSPHTALGFALECLEQHAPGTPSATFWAAVVADLSRHLGKPHTKSERRQLREHRA